MTDTKQRTERMADATADAVADLLQQARQTNDPFELVELRGKVKTLDPAYSLEGLLALTDLVADAKPTDIVKSQKAVTAAERAVENKRNEYADTVARLDKELEAALEQYRTAKASHALAQVGHNRLSAMQTGTPAPGYSQFASDVMQIWARKAGIVK